MPSAVDLTAAVAVAIPLANDHLVALVRQQAEVKEWEEREAKEATIGSPGSGSDFG